MARRLTDRSANTDPVARVTKEVGHA